MTVSSRRNERRVEGALWTPFISACRCWSSILSLLLLVILAHGSVVNGKVGRHRSNHAVILSSSRYWFNYRHVINALSIYQLCKAHGIPDENIVLMLADEIPINARNPFKNGMFSSGAAHGNTLYTPDTEIDYRGDDVTVDNLVNVLLGTHDEQPQLRSDQDSNVLLYWTGHGGDQFFKFQDVEEITAQDIAQVLNRMHELKRYRELLFVIDTCQGFTLADFITAPNVYVVASTKRGENAYAHHSDPLLGMSVIERYTHFFMELVKNQKLSKWSIQHAMIDRITATKKKSLHATIGYRDDLGERNLGEIPLSDFFANTGAVLNNNNDTRLSPLRPLSQPMTFSLFSKETTFMDTTDSKNDSPSEQQDEEKVCAEPTSPADESNGNSKECPPAHKQVEPVEPGSIPFLLLVLLFACMILLSSDW